MTTTESLSKGEGMNNPGILLSNGTYTTGTQGEKVRRARKDYICGDLRADEAGCGLSISIGDFYIAVANPIGMYGELTRHYHLVCPIKEA